MKIRNVLIYPGFNPIGNEIFNSLKYIKDLELFSVENNRSKSELERNVISLPEIGEKSWLSNLQDLIEEYSIHLLYPTDFYLNFELLENKDKIKRIVVSSPLNTLKRFPLSERNIRDFDYELSRIKFRKKFSGEFTIFCIMDRVRGLIFSAGLNTQEFDSRTSSKIKLVFQEEFTEIARLISHKLEFHGSWSYNICFTTEGSFIISNISPIVDERMKILRFFGVNLPLLNIYEQERDKFEILPSIFPYEIAKNNINQFRILIEYDEIIVDLDDTLIFKDRVNTKLLDFLHKSRNMGKKLILISKHRGKINETLKSFKINPILFDKVLHLKMNEHKSNYISSKKSIFIDDSFQERKEVYERCRIPVFDLSMIDSL